MCLHIQDIEANEEPEQIDVRIRKIIHDGSDRFFSRHKRKDGQILEVEVSKHYVETLGERIFAFVRDITERKHTEIALRESESRFRQLANSLPQLVWTCQPDGPCDFLSQQWLSYTGVPEAQQLGYGWLDQLHPDDRTPSVNAWQVAAASGTDFHVEFRIRRHDGEYRWFDTQAVRLLDSKGRNVKWFGSNTDITDRKQAEQQIRQLNADLEQRVIQRTYELQAANADLEAFSYSVSHDLRAPLRAIDGFSAILREEYADKLDAEGQRLFRIVGDNAKKMGQLIDDILAFSRAGRIELQLIELDMNAMANLVWQEMEVQRAGRSIEFRLADLPVVRGDPAAIRQVLQNILSNAVKFTAGCAPAIIEVSGRREMTEIIYSVKDNGVGFDMQYAAKLFGLFQRLHGMEEFEGTGVGLSIVKRFVTKHGGRVWAEGRVGEGATFFFSLPT